MASPCPCRGCINAYKAGYTDGYIEAMALNKNLDVMDWVYGQNSPRVLRENERIINGEVYVQHGRGENP